MDEMQKEFLQALIDCGLSMNTLLAVGTIITTEASMKLMTSMILEAEEQGETITDSLVLQILTDIMKNSTSSV